MTFFSSARPPNREFHREGNAVGARYSFLAGIRRENACSPTIHETGCHLVVRDRILAYFEVLGTVMYQRTLPSLAVNMNGPKGLPGMDGDEFRLPYVIGVCESH